MLERLSQADAQIRAFNQRLAAEIEKATHDLSEKNATLGQLNRLLNDMRLDNASKVRLATLGQLAAQLAHEIGTPLSSVSGHIQLALLQRDLGPALRERLEVSAREIERISKIVRDYLDSTRPLEPERQPTALPPLLEEAVELVAGRAPRAGACAVELAGRPRRCGEVVTDPGLLRQIVVNLLSNASTPSTPADDGRVTRRRPSRSATTCSSPSATPGTASRPTICAGSSSRSTRPRGAARGPASGLAICRQLSAALGGTISVESEPGKGSTFFVRLPRQGPPVAAGGETRPRAAGAPEGARERPTRVLVAEDDRVARDLLCEILRGEGYEVEAVDDGAGAIERAAGGTLRPGRLRRAHGALGRPRRARGLHRARPRTRRSS